MGRVTTLAAVLAAFGIYTALVVAGHGYLGFLVLAWQDEWAGQMLVDLVIALVLVLGWMQDDARERGLPYWPYLALTLTTGSIGPLAYLLHRSVRELRHERVAAAD